MCSLEESIAKSKLPKHSQRPKALQKNKLRLRRKKISSQKIVIDREQGLVFDSEQEMFEHFKTQVEYFESFYDKHRREGDIQESEVGSMEEELDQTLDTPSEIWHDGKTFKEFPIFYFIRPLEQLGAFHVAVTYVSSEDEPTFIFLHFITKFAETLNHFRKGDLVYDRAYEEIGFAAIEGDALGEGDPLAMGLFLTMLKLRGESDIAFDQFQSLGQELREETVENADEIWRSQANQSGIQSSPTVTFIKEFPDHALGNVFYLAVTQEDTNTSVHTLLFSFPTTDPHLVDRYRFGENLQAEEVVQESSH